MNSSQNSSNSSWFSSFSCSALRTRGFDLVAADGQTVVADALVACSEARQPVRAGHDETRAAHAALRQPGEQVLRAPRSSDVAAVRDRAPRCLLSLFRGVPQLVADDAQRRDAFRDPLGRRIQSRHALARVRVLHVAQTIPDHPPDVQFVVQDARSALRVAVNRARTPAPAERACDAFPVQRLDDGFGRHAGHEVAEDPFDNRGLFRFDLSLTGCDGSGVQCLDDAIAVAETASRLAVLNATAQSAVCLLGEILQEQGVHRALESDVQVRDVALGKRDDVHAGKGEALEEPPCLPGRG